MAVRNLTLLYLVCLDSIIGFLGSCEALSDFKVSLTGGNDNSIQYCTFQSRYCMPLQTFRRLRWLLADKKYCGSCS